MLRTGTVRTTFYSNTYYMLYTKKTVPIYVHFMVFFTQENGFLRLLCYFCCYYCVCIVNSISTYISIYMTLAIDVVDGHDLRNELHYKRSPGNAGN